MALLAADRTLLERCLAHQSGSWNDFVDRFLGLIYHVVRHTAHLRSLSLLPEDIEDVAAEILQRIAANDYAVLRHFRQQSSLAAYLAVIARRICITELVRRAPTSEAAHKEEARPRTRRPAEPPADSHLGLEKLEEVQRLLRKLPSRERQVVRLHYLEGRSYEEISTALGIPVRSIGPVLARARQRLSGGVSSQPPAAGRDGFPKAARRVRW